jgi:hypothetical protein
LMTGRYDFNTFCRTVTPTNPYDFWRKTEQHAQVTKICILGNN